MAIVLEANYAKKLGLPNCSSHQYCVTIRTELTDLSQVEAESAKLYVLLQDAVDREIQNAARRNAKRQPFAVTGSPPTLGESAVHAEEQCGPGMVSR